MRITHQITTSNLLTYMNASRNRVGTLMNQLSSGIRIHQPSDDPTGAAEVMRSNSRLGELDNWDVNLQDAQTWVRTTESDLNNLKSMVDRAYELAITTANETYSGDNRKLVAEEVTYILQDMITTLNDKGVSGSLFAGFKTDVAPFSIDMTTGAVTYGGDSGDMQRIIGPGLTMVVNLRGDRVDNWADPNNMLTTVWQFLEDLKNDNRPGVELAVGKLQKAQDRIISLTTEIGAKDGHIEQLRNHNQDMKLYFNKILEQTQGVDMEKAILDLNSAQMTYEAALQVGAKILPPNLADFLR